MNEGVSEWVKPAVSYLFFRPLGDDSEPVSYHAEDRSKVG